MFEYQIRIVIDGYSSEKDLSSLEDQLRLAIETGINGISDNILGHITVKKNELSVIKDSWLQGWINP